MTAKIVALADAVTTALAGHEFSLAIEPERSYADDEMQLNVAEALRVDVVVVGHDEAELQDRGHLGYLSGLDIGVRFKFGGQEQATDGRIEVAEIDKLTALVEEIYVFLAKSRFDDAIWRDATIRATYVRKHLREWRQFTGIIRVRFHVSQEI